MNFTPVIPFGGASGWAFLQRTLSSQKSAFEASPVVQRDITYFKDNIGAVNSAEDLVSDHQLLKVALGAYGLDDDVANKFFVKKVLDDGTLDAGDLANKLSDKRYLEFAKDFGFGDFDTPRSKDSQFGEKITEAYKSRQFEIAVGEQDSDMRLVLSLDRELSEIAGKSISNDAKWYSVLGNPPLRQVFETAFGLPDSFASLDIEKQLDVFKGRSESQFGSSEVHQFLDQGSLAELKRLFLVRSEISSLRSSMTSGSIALTLLQNM